MQVYKIPPYDQNLSVDGRYLTDTKQTLGQLKVLPKSLIYLRADEPTPGSAAAASHVSETEECWTAQNPEEGFKGEKCMHFIAKPRDWLLSEPMRRRVYRNTWLATKGCAIFCGV